MPIVIARISGAGLLSSEILIDAVLFHQRTNDTTKRVLLLDFHQREIAHHILHAAVQRCAIGLQESMPCLSQPDADDLVSLNLGCAHRFRCLNGKIISALMQNLHENLIHSADKLWIS